MASEYKFVSTNADEIVSAMVTAYEALTKKSLAPASPERLFITWAADIIVQLRSLINYAANQNIPSRAEGGNLDAIAELFYEKKRPDAAAAQCTMQFNISAAQSSTVVVPAGTRITDTNNTLVWETTADITIAIGNTSATGTAVCQNKGEEGNGWLSGQITELIDVYPYYSSCSNITTSDGGYDKATDEAFYKLLRASEDGYSTAGASGSYQYWAKTASTEIEDVVVIQPIETISETVSVVDHKLFLGGSYLKENTLVVKSGSTSLVEDTDYTVDYEDGLMTITLLSESDYYSSESLTVSIDNVLAGEVWIYGLMNDGSLPTDTLKNKILSICNSDEVRPLTDKVSVKDPTTVTYNIALTYYIPRDSAASASEITNAVTAAVEEYKSWQAGKLGRDINPSKLISLLMETGIKRVAVTSPSYQVLNDGLNNKPPELASVGTVTITNGGFEHE